MNISACSGILSTTWFSESPWIALAVIFITIAGVNTLGTWLRRRRSRVPRAAPPAKAEPPVVLPPVALIAESAGPTPQTLAIIAAAIRVTLGATARIAQIVPVKPAATTVELQTQHWSMEGRRQIYSSHQVR